MYPSAFQRIPYHSHWRNSAVRPLYFTAAVIRTKKTTEILSTQDNFKSLIIINEYFTLAQLKSSDNELKCEKYFKFIAPSYVSRRWDFALRK